MLKWVEVVLKPYVALAPPHIVPIVLLDSFKVHMVGSVTRAIEALGCEVFLRNPISVNRNLWLSTIMVTEWFSTP